MVRQNILADIPAQLFEELFTPLAEDRHFKLERIVSAGQATPAGTWLKQGTAEWVMVVSGRAKLFCAGDAAAVELGPGDYCLIPAHTPHRVEWTDPEGKTVWLALHFHQESAREQNLLRSASQFFIDKVKVVRSARRRRTAAARMHKDTMYVHVPAKVSAERLESIIKDFKEKLQKKMLKARLNSAEDLTKRAGRLARQIFGRPLDVASIEYVTDQWSKFGCCDFRHRSIRISHHVAAMPSWVRDYVLVHELAHLVHPDHGSDFWALVNRYRLTERAKGYLLAKGYDLQDENI